MNTKSGFVKKTILPILCAFSALKNLGTEKSYNPFGISTHNLSYFMLVSYSFSKKDYKSLNFKLVLKKPFLKIF